MTMRYKGRSRSEPIPPNAQDRISFMLALAVAPAGAKTGDYHLVDGRGVSHHVYQFAGRERVQTLAGAFEAVKVVRSKDGDHAEFLLASALGGLPVRMLAVEKGTVGIRSRPASSASRRASCAGRALLRARAARRPGR